MLPCVDCIISINYSIFFAYVISLFSKCKTLVNGLLQPVNSPLKCELDPICLSKYSNKTNNENEEVCCDIYRHVAWAAAQWVQAECSVTADHVSGLPGAQINKCSLLYDYVWRQIRCSRAKLASKLLTKLVSARLTRQNDDALLQRSICASLQQQQLSLAAGAASFLLF